MSNPFLTRINKRSKTSHGTASEKRLAKKLGGELHAGSGSLSRKADFRKNKILHECKSTIHESISIKLDWLQKVEKQALLVGKRPVLNLSFVRDNGEPKLGGDWICMRLADYQELIGE